MATFSATYIPGAPDAIKLTINATSSGSQLLGTNRLFAIQADANVSIAFFNSASTSPVTASANSWPLIANGIAEFDTGSAYDSVSIYNAGASAAHVWIFPLARI